MTSPEHEFTYLSADDLVEINEDQENGGGVRDREALNRCVDRPTTEAFGTGFRTIWEKAAAYVHGIARNHPFLEANKHTALYAAATFLDLNGHQLPDIETIEAETFVLAIALDVFDTDEDPGRTLAKAAEWFQTRCEAGRRSGPVRHLDLEYVFLAGFAVLDQFHTMWVVRGGLSAMGVQNFPHYTDLYVVGRWHGQQTGRIRVTIVAPPGGTHPENNSGSDDLLTMPQLAGMPWLPARFVVKLQPVFRDPANYTVVVALDDDAIAELPLKVVSARS